MKVTGKQRNSRMCFICGMDNPVGFHSQFYNMEDGSVLDAVKALPENYRNAIYLHYYEGYTTAEIGRMLKVPTNTVLSWLRRARAQLQTMLKEEIEDEVV